MDYVKLWTTVHDDPDLRRLSDRAFREYVYAWSWCGKHETDGVYDVMAGLVSAKSIRELVARERLCEVDSEHYSIRGWEKRQVSKATLERRRAAGKAAADARWSAVRSTDGNANRIRTASTVPNAKVEEQVEVEEQTTPSASRKRDAVFDALAEITGGDPYAMTRREARACATALADIRKATPDVSPEMLAERAENYRAHMPQATLTPSALAAHWSRCGRPPITRTSDRIARITKEAMA